VEEPDTYRGLKKDISFENKDKNDDIES